MGTPTELKKQFGDSIVDEVFVRLARPPASQRRAGERAHDELRAGGRARSWACCGRRRTTSSATAGRSVVITLMPVLQVIIFGYAIRTDVDHVRLAIVDPRARLRTRSRCAADSPRPTCFASSACCRRTADLDRLFQRGDAQEAIVFEPGFAGGWGRAFRRACRSSPTRRSRTPGAPCRPTRCR